jgi:hypothetical protein
MGIVWERAGAEQGEDAAQRFNAAPKQQLLHHRLFLFRSPYLTDFCTFSPPPCVLVTAEPDREGAVRPGGEREPGRQGALAAGTGGQ